MNNQDQEYRLTNFVLRTILIFSVVAIFGLGIVLLPIPYPNIKPTELGSLGNAFSGFALPLIAIAGALLTFLAFYIQFLANLQVQKQFKIQQFESQFYEMIRLHKENINEMIITGYDLSKQEKIEYRDSERKSSISSSVVKITAGRKVFVTMTIELICCYELLLYYNKLWQANHKEEDLLELAYQIFFYGAKSELVGVENFSSDRTEVFKTALNSIRKKHKDSNGVINAFPGINGQTIELYIKYSPFSGHESRIGHYYRHLYSTVKFVVDQDGKLFDYKQVRGYLKLLRSQMSNDEVLMLYYNGVIGFGKDWESKGFFTKYRMLHNLPIGKVKYVTNPRIHFKKYIESIKYENDPMFEWGDYDKKVQNANLAK